MAHYRAAFRLAALLTFTQFAVNALGAPTFGALHAAGDRAGLRRTVHRIGWLNTAVAVPGLLFLLALGPWLLSFWGSAFASAEAVTALGILAAAQALNALSGPVMYLLNMTGGERAGLLILALSAAVQVVLGVMLVPDHGLIGAALSAAIGMAVWNGVGLLWVRRARSGWFLWRTDGGDEAELLPDRRTQGGHHPWHARLSRHPQVYLSPLKDESLRHGHRPGPVQPGIPLQCPRRPQGYLADRPCAPGKSARARPGAIPPSVRRGAAEHAVVGECSTSYLWSKEAASHVAEAYFEARILCVLRNPVSGCIRIADGPEVRLHDGGSARRGETGPGPSRPELGTQ